MPFVQWSGFTDHLLDKKLSCDFDGEHRMLGILGYKWLRDLVPDEKE